MRPYRIQDQGQSRFNWHLDGVFPTRTPDNAKGWGPRQRKTCRPFGGARQDPAKARGDVSVPATILANHLAWPILRIALFLAVGFHIAVVGL